MGFCVRFRLKENLTKMRLSGDASAFIVIIELQNGDFTKLQTGRLWNFNTPSKYMLLTNQNFYYKSNVLKFTFNASTA